MPTKTVNECLEEIYERLGQLEEVVDRFITATAKLFGHEEDEKD